LHRLEKYLALAVWAGLGGRGTSSGRLLYGVYHGKTLLWYLHWLGFKYSALVLALYLAVQDLASYLPQETSTPPAPMYNIVPAEVFSAVLRGESDRGEKGARGGTEVGGRGADGWSQVLCTCHLPQPLGQLPRKLVLRVRVHT
jgi:hypothetical protein